MGDYQDQARFREHLAEMRRAASGLGHDFASEITDLDVKIEKFGHATAKDAKYLASDIEDGMSNLGRKIDDEMRRLPGRIADGASRAGGATRDALIAAGKRTREGTRNALASAAGVNRKPMKTWSAPSDSASSDEQS
ncbi:MAG TPA: hypothetical protein VK424_03555 [Thermoplasmata archaeon]|nr:hypothetical protein [Thermoplasmata archaeon]